MYEIYEFHNESVQLSLVDKPTEFYSVTYVECLEFVRMGLIR